LKLGWLSRQHNVKEVSKGKLKKARNLMYDIIGKRNAVPVPTSARAVPLLKRIPPQRLVPLKKTKKKTTTKRPKKKTTTKRPKKKTTTKRKVKKK
jgi:hypothetical protein